MKRFFVAALWALPLFWLSGCSSTPADCEDDVVDIVIARKPQNVQSVIFLVNQNTGDLACCRDTEYTTAEECARALEQTCFKRVEDIPFGTAKYDFLTDNTYPTRRWRNNERNPRW
ncbi:MAG: hypothetical protein IJ689_06840 [Alphaproteobacteria bacterium]|nr:hypothetical protein [Alphaproteobacteria bacterium]